MRTELKKIIDNRLRFSGEFVRIGIKNGWKGETLETILLSNIKNESGKVVTDHLWFNYTLGFQKLGNLKAGNRIEFDARVTNYKRGYFGKRLDVEYNGKYGIDYKLERPTKLKRVAI